MDARTAALAQLKEFGLSAYAARAYLALLELGVAEARGVSELAGIPTAKVYGTLLQLQRRGLAEVTPGKPRKYAPVPMEEFVERQLREQEEHTEALRERRDALVDLFPVVGTAHVGERARTTTIAGRRNVMQHLREACDGASDHIFGVMTPALAADAATRRLLDQAAARGVQVRILEDATDANLHKLTRAFPQARFDPGTRQAETLLVVTFDDRVAMLLHFSRDRAKDRREGETAIHTSEPAFVQPLRRLLALRVLAEDGAGDASGADPAPSATAHVDTRTFERRVAEQVSRPPGQACAVVVADDAKDLSRDRLWNAASAAARARILLSLPLRRWVDPTLREHIPAHAQVKLLPRPSGIAFAVLDGRHAFFVSHSRTAREKEDPMYAVTADAAVVRALEAQFEASWAIGAPLPGARPVVS